MSKTSFLQVALLLILSSPPFMFGQPFETVLYSFGSIPNDGTTPAGNLAFDSAGHIYGATVNGGSSNRCQFGCGTVFELAQKNGEWSETVIYNFTGLDGANPSSGVISDGGGNLYGTTLNGGSYGEGNVFELSPPAQPGGNWTEITLWSFGGDSGDGFQPDSQTLVLDQSGDLYGVTGSGGQFGGGIIYKILVSPVPGGSTESILYNFCQNSRPPNCADGYWPSGVALDSAGNLFGTTKWGGAPCPTNGCGTTFELSQNPNGWEYSVLFYFSRKRGAVPLSRPSVDQAGNIYGTVSEDGNGCCGGVFRLSFNGKAWNEVLIGFTDLGGFPDNVLVAGKTGYGTDINGGNERMGYIFEIAGKTKTVLYDFCSQPSCTDGASPSGPLAILKRQLVGATLGGGTHNQGVIFALGN